MSRFGDLVGGLDLALAARDVSRCGPPRYRNDEPSAHATASERHGTRQVMSWSVTPLDTWQAIDSIRVVRAFAERPLTAEHLDRILSAGRRAGSSKNEQLWAFIVVQDRDRLREL